jgi:antitoxin VapB
MDTRTAKLFMNGKSQAVRLPKEFRFDDIGEVFIRKRGDELILSVKRASWDDFFDTLEHFSDDFMTNRNQPELQQREDMF